MRAQRPNATSSGAGPYLTAVRSSPTWLPAERSALRCADVAEHDTEHGQQKRCAHLVFGRGKSRGSVDK